MSSSSSEPAAKWKTQRHGNGLWFRGQCQNTKCEARDRLIIAAPFLKYDVLPASSSSSSSAVDGVCTYTWKLLHNAQLPRPPPPPHRPGEYYPGINNVKPKPPPKPRWGCVCCCCGAELRPVEANFTNCRYKLDGIKIVGHDLVRWRSKGWTNCNDSTRRSCWEEVNGMGGLEVKWHSLTITVQVGGNVHNTVTKKKKKTTKWAHAAARSSQSVVSSSLALMSSSCFDWHRLLYG